MGLVALHRSPLPDAGRIDENFSDDEFRKAEDIPESKSLCQNAEFSFEKGRPYSRRGSIK